MPSYGLYDTEVKSDQKTSCEQCKHQDCEHCELQKCEYVDTDTMGQLDCLSVRETWDVSFTWPGTLKKSSIKGQTGHCSALPWPESDGLSRGTLGHPKSPIKEKSNPPGLERVVQSISPYDRWTWGVTWSVYGLWVSSGVSQLWSLYI